MSTIRRYGISFHLIPMPTEGLWLEVIRESDGAVLVAQEFTGDSDLELSEAVDEWVGEIVQERVLEIDVPTCRLCASRRRDTQDDEDGRTLPDFLVEWHFDLCPPCGARLEATSPWMREYLKDRYGYDDDTDAERNEEE